jgi:acetylornithine deacetylase
VATIRDAIAADRSFALETLLELVGTGSIAPEERGAQEVFVRAAQQSGLESQLLPIPVERLKEHKRHFETGLPYAGRPNALVRLRGGPGRPIVLNSHIDTVRAADGWTRDVRGELVGSRVYGLGSADAKGCLVAALTAARALRRLRVSLSSDLVIQSVIDEEGSGNGTLAALLSTEEERPRIAVVLEPTDLEVAYGHRGMLSFDLLCRGRSAHGATSGGVNAIVLAAKAILSLEELGNYLAELQEPGYLPPRLNVGIIGGGHEVYTTPDRCLVRFSVRYAPKQRSEVVRRVREAIRAFQSKTMDAAHSELVGELDFDAAETRVDRGLPLRFVEAARTIRPETMLTTLAATCDARHFAHLSRVPVLVFGPGKLKHAHAADEHVEVSDVLNAAAVLATFAASV